MWWALVALAAAQDCEKVSFGDIVEPEAPAVIVLGERKGHQPDLKRAWKVVAKLSKRGPVTLALESVHREAQEVLDKYERGGLDPVDLPDLIGWLPYWDFPWEPYEKLVTSSLIGVHVVAAGLDLGPRPDHERVPLPPGYVNLLVDALGDHPVAVELEGDFVEAVAWRDHAVARIAIEQWDRKGYLVILADRFHVEGGLGVQWQAQRLVQLPVSSALLVSADSPCYRDDRVWK